MSGREHDAWVTYVRSADACDSLPALNGVKVGQLWANHHTLALHRVREIRNGGAGTYIGHEAAAVCDDVDEHGNVVERDWSQDHPIWGLGEHWDLVAEPDERPQLEHVDENGRPLDGQLTFWCEQRWKPRPDPPCLRFRDHRYDPRPGYRSQNHGWLRLEVRSCVRERPGPLIVAWEGQGGTSWSLHEPLPLSWGGVAVLCNGIRVDGMYRYGPGPNSSERNLETMIRETAEQHPWAKPVREWTPQIELPLAA